MRYHTIFYDHLYLRQADSVHISYTLNFLWGATMSNVIFRSLRQADIVHISYTLNFLWGVTMSNVIFRIPRQAGNVTIWDAPIHMTKSSYNVVF